MINYIEEVFSEKSPLREILLQYEVRNEQREMAYAVYDALKNSKLLLVEAGTGVGKTLSYLVASVLWIKETNNKVLVATYTKVLQDQILKKDFPILRKLFKTLFFDYEINCAVIYGQENYICKRRLVRLSQYGLFDSPAESVELEHLNQWLETGGSGIIPEFEYTLGTLAEKVSRDTDICKYQKCEYYENCYYFRARNNWLNAPLLVTNHSLFFANVASDYAILPKFSAVIFDEAHRLEENAAKYFGLEISNIGLTRLFNSISNPQRSSGLLAHLNVSAQVSNVVNELLDKARAATDNLFYQLLNLLPADETKLRITKPLNIKNDLDYILSDLRDVLLEIAINEVEEDLALEIKSRIKKLESYRISINQFLEFADKNSVYWIETASSPHKKTPIITLNSALIDISGLFKKHVVEKIPSIILTSATLTVNKSFHFIASRLGLDNIKTLYLSSPFNYQSQALLVVPTDIPLPTDEEKFYPKIAEVINQILKMSGGRALVLFTSYKALNKTYELIDKSGFTFLVQGQEPSNVLMNKFRTDISSVLFATQSFWQGVDFPGETLSCLIIVRLPFDVPDDPRLEGIRERLQEQNIEPFFNFQLPNAVLKFRQGFGRLIRSKHDRGVICVLDKRIVTKEYGKHFIFSLPPKIPLALSISAIKDFFSKIPSDNK
ncbi:MAG: helicase C-terminal domain-containing protein [candidate division WOR-3 bacterium]|nr:DEAD/DEAH box helicase family protein [candidate division WOR-3 bacterium]MDW7987949.1 helicase C-terminal domain-containing protein [candidate division WOR-3 bacterium]